MEAPFFAAFAALVEIGRRLGYLVEPTGENLVKASNGRDPFIVGTPDKVGHHLLRLERRP